MLLMLKGEFSEKSFNNCIFTTFDSAVRAIGTGKATKSHWGTQIGVQESPTTTMERIVLKLALVAEATFGGMMFHVTALGTLSVKSTSRIKTMMSSRGSFKCYVFFVCWEGGSAKL